MARGLSETGKALLRAADEVPIRNCRRVGPSSDDIRIDKVHVLCPTRTENPFETSVGRLCGHQTEARDAIAARVARDLDNDVIIPGREPGNR
jgi:hypothetical protein